MFADDPHSIELEEMSQPCPERRLFSAVVMRAIEDVCGGAGPCAARQAEQWVGSCDFRAVAAMAGLDAEALEDRLRPVLALPVKARRDWWRGRLLDTGRSRELAGGACRFPGCTRTVGPNSRWRLCREHAHADGLCQCAMCYRRGRAA